MHYRITNRTSGLDLGIYEADDEDGAIRSMLADEDCSEEPSSDLYAYKVSAREAMSFAEALTFGGRWPVEA